MEELKRHLQEMGAGGYLLLAVLASSLAGSLLNPGSFSTRQQHQAQPVRDPMKLIAPPTDPVMADAIRIALMPVAGEGSAWSKHKGTGPTATFRNGLGTITLHQSEIAEANNLYPQLVHNPAIRADLHSAGRSTSAYADDYDAPGEWGEGTR